jgi:hypothetical protein
MFGGGGGVRHLTAPPRTGLHYLLLGLDFGDGRQEMGGGVEYWML